METRPKHLAMCPRSKVQAEWTPCQCDLIRKVRKAMQQDIGIWLTVQSQTARYAKKGQHPDTMFNTQSDALNWAAGQVLKGNADKQGETNGP